MTDWKGKNVLVTGACGFIGSHLAERLVRAGATTTALAFYDARGGSGWLDSVPDELRREMRIVSGDVRDSEQMRRLTAGQTVVFHLAALIGIPYSYLAPRSYVETNITGSVNMLEACRDANARLIQTSTSEVYGTALTVPMSENHPLQAQSPYAATKIAADQLALSYHRAFGTPVTIVRPFNTYGPRQSARAVIPTIFAQILSGSDPFALGDPTPTRDFNYVADTVDAFLRLGQCDSAVGRIVNVGTGIETSVGDLATMAARMAGKTMTIAFDERRRRPDASEVRRLCADAALLKELTGWKPATPLAEGLRLTMEWMTAPTRGNYDHARYFV
jgi:NAD dependent epimerase/dehydratase